MDFREKILQFIRIRGPVLPVQISKEINTDILIASAHLSELASNKKLRLSCLKIGGSPLYYIPGQEPRLQSFSQYLHDKEKKTYDMLSQKKILKDAELDPLSRVTIRQIKDFAVPLQVNYRGNLELFWKWYLLPTNDAEEAIKAIINAPEQPESQPEAKEEQEIVTTEKTGQKRDQEQPKEEMQTKIQEKKAEKSEKTKKQQTQKPQKASITDFAGQITDYFSKNNIEIIEKNILRKNSELEFIIKVPSSVGSLTYFCKAKNKKTINDGDLSSVFIQSQSRKLPVLLLTTGDLTKKAKELLEKEFRGMHIKRIG